MFNQKTLPQIMNANLNKNSIKELCSSFVDFIRFNYHDKEFTVTNAGLPFYPKSSDVKKITSLFYIKGAGGYELDVDKMWAENAFKDHIQVHGHRNKKIGMFMLEERPDPVNKILISLRYWDKKQMLIFMDHFINNNCDKIKLFLT